MSWLLLLMQQKHECVAIFTVCSDSLGHIARSCVAELSVLLFIFLKKSILIYITLVILLFLVTVSKVCLTPKFSSTFIICFFIIVILAGGMETQCGFYLQNILNIGI